eukprot:1966254-Rhodomonas_salina.1
MLHRVFDALVRRCDDHRGVHVQPERLGQGIARGDETFQRLLHVVDFVLKQFGAAVRLYDLVRAADRPRQVQLPVVMPVTLVVDRNNAVTEARLVFEDLRAPRVDDHVNLASARFEVFESWANARADEQLVQILDSTVWLLHPLQGDSKIVTVIPEN